MVGLLLSEEKDGVCCCWSGYILGPLFGGGKGLWRDDNHGRFFFGGFEEERFWRCAGLGRAGLSARCLVGRQGLIARERASVWRPPIEIWTVTLAKEEMCVDSEVLITRRLRLWTGDEDPQGGQVVCRRGWISLGT